MPAPAIIAGAPAAVEVIKGNIRDKNNLDKIVVLQKGKIITQVPGSNGTFYITTDDLLNHKEIEVAIMRNEVTGRAMKVNFDVG